MSCTHCPHHCPDSERLDKQPADPERDPYNFIPLQTVQPDDGLTPYQRMMRSEKFRGKDPFHGLSGW